VKEVCINHSDRPAEYMCEQCGKTFCSECKVEKTYDAMSIDLCPECGAKLFELAAKPSKKEKEKSESSSSIESFGPAVPIISPGQIISNALEDWQYASSIEALTAVGIQAVFFAVFLALADSLLPGILLFLIFPLAVTVSFIMEALRGAFDDTDLFVDPLGSREFFFTVVGDFIRFIASLTIPASFLGAVALLWINVLGKAPETLFSIDFFISPMAIGGIALATLFWPMAFAQAAKKETVWEIFWPLNKLNLFKGGGNLIVQWAVLLTEAVFIYILVLVGLKLFPKVEIFFVHGLVVAIFFALGVSTFIAFARTVGRTYAQAVSAAENVTVPVAEEGDMEEAASLEPIPQDAPEEQGNAAVPQQSSTSDYDSHEPSYGDYGMVEASSGSDALQYELSLAVENHNLGKYAEAEKQYRKILNQNSTHKEALTGYFNLLVQMQRSGEVQDMAMNVLRAAHADKNYAEAVHVWRETVALAPRFSLPAKPLYFVARAMHEEHEYQDAASLYRRVAEENPNTPVAAASLIRCSEVLGIHLGRKDIAKQMLGYVKSNYPNTPHQAEADQLLQEIMGELNQ